MSAKLPQLILIDNYDSFAHNLARYATLAGAHVTVMRNDACPPDALAAQKPDGVILSPGPCTPHEAGLCVPLVRQLAGTVPILGVCLGHQAISEAYGGRTIKAPAPVHGRSSLIVHHGQSRLFTGVPSPFEGGRYHSLIADLSAAPDLIPTAHTQEDHILMAFQHRTHPVYGIQFHPESILSACGQQIIQNFVRIVLEWRS